MKVDIDVRNAEVVRATMRELGDRARPALVSSINRTARDLRSRVLTKTTGVYNISRRDLSPYVVLSGATRSKVSATVSLKIRAVPVERFKPRVRMQKFTFEIRGRTVTRKLPAVYLRRFKGGAEKRVGPAFPLHQRRSGRLSADDAIRRRIDERRDRLTRIRYYTFPQQFLAEELLPDALRFIPERMTLEMQRALRRYNSRGDRALRGNA